jgi:hypothetical protein
LQKQHLRIQTENKAAVLNMQQSVQSFTQTLNAVPSSGGMDFDQRNSNTSSNSSSNASGLTFMSQASDAKQKTTVKELQFGDPNVVDARKVPTGLPADVANSIPHTPTGDRVCKGLEAIQAHDWKVALAWFQDALNKQPSDPGLERLVDLAKYTLQRQNKVASGQSGDKTGLNGALNDYNQNLLSKHPEFKRTNLSDNKFLKQEDPAWVQFFKYINSKLPKPPQPDPAHTAANGIRG